MRPALNPNARGISQHKVLGLFLHLIGWQSHRRAGVAALFGRHPAARGLAVAGELHFPEDHALIDESAKRLWLRHVPAIEEHLVPEAAIEQVEHRVFSAADVEIHGHPRPLHLRIDQTLRVRGIQESEEIPARSCPLRHRVCFASVAFAVAGDQQPVVASAAERRLKRAAGTKVGELGQLDREFACLDGANRPGGLAIGIQFVKDWKRLAPKSLPAEEPVSQLVVDGPSAQPCGPKIVRHLLNKQRRFEACIAARRNAAAVACKKLVWLQWSLCCGRMRRKRLHNRERFKPKGQSKFGIPLVVGWHRHDRTGAVRGQHIVGHPHRNRLACQRMDAGRASEHAGFFGGQIGAIQIALPRGRFAVHADRFGLARGCELLQQWVFRGDNQIGHSVERVGPCRVDPQAIGGRLGRKATTQASRFPN